MKHSKYFFAALALLASCNQGEVLVDMPETEPSAPARIGFETFVNKSTRAAGENSTALNDFYETFYVYGWKFVNGTETCVFNNIPVEFFAADEAGDVVYTAGKPSDEWVFTANSWYYENVRYWDKMASSYQFCAFTPAPSGVAIDCASDGVIKIGTVAAPVTVDSKNLMATPATKLAYTGFDRDYMTATSATAASPVSLNFEHLQAKFNVRIKLDADMKTKQNVVVKKVEIHNLGDRAYYVSNAAGTVNGWSLGAASSDYKLETKAEYSLNAATNYNNHYVIEQLIIPQTITKAADTPSLTEYTNACVYVEYYIGSERFYSYTPLANIFNATGAENTYTFEAGKQYTLNITVGPDPIYFKAEVIAWETEVEGDLDMD